MAIEKLERADEDVLRDINALLGQISTRAKHCSLELLRQIVASAETELWVVREDTEIVGMATFALIYRPEGIAARIEDVVVRNDMRGKGYGKLLLQKLVERAKERDAKVIQLTSNSSRTAANALYQKLGFSIHQTNSYELKL